MDLKRIVLYCALMLTVMSLWNAWQHDYPSAPVASTNTTSSLPVSSNNVLPANVIKDNTQSTSSTVSASATSTNIATTNAINTKDLIHVRTDVLNISIDPLGGNIIQANVLNYYKKLDGKDPVTLFTNDPNRIYIAQSGLVGNLGPDTSQGQAKYHTDKSQYQLMPGQNDVTVHLTWQNKGLNVEKSFVFHRNDYAIEQDYKIDNHSNTAWTGQYYMQIKRKDVPEEERGLFHISSYKGTAISSPEKPYEKISFDKMSKQNLDRTIKGGWITMQQHYFLSAWIPSDENEMFNYYSNVTSDKVYTIGMISHAFEVSPGSEKIISQKLYVGPEIMDRLKKLAPGLDLTIDYGWLWFVSIGLFWLLKQIYSVVGNWGWAIVVVTILVKLLFYHLSASSYKSMAAMRKLQPKILALKEQYGEDRQKLNMETMALYKKEKINPLGGCLPILVQIPVFIALYWVLIESVELRHAPFTLWVMDLSAKDPYYVLPVLMGLTMFLQQKLNPPPPDPTQAKVMMLMPVILTVFFINFPAGLVLYWVVNNALSIVQQWYIMRKIEKAEETKKMKR